MSEIVITKKDLLDCLRDGDFERFNRLYDKGVVKSLANVNLRGCDLKSVKLEGVSLNGAILGHADIRGLDFRSCDMEGASIKNAKISGTFFPDNISSNEILMSKEFGTRMRADRK